VRSGRVREAVNSPQRAIVMASDTKPKKANKSKYADPKTGEFRHADGDRRHRKVGAMAKQAGKNKQLRREFDGGIPIDEPPGEPNA
jgi:hypothetical protein